VTARSGRTCQVVPAIASFSVDDGFRYAIPDDLDLAVGDRVRVRVGGRRLRGFVTAVFADAEEPARPLVDVDGRVGTLPSYDEGDLEMLRWCATHYVAPMSVILARTTPPNVPRSTRRPPERRIGAGFAVGAVASAAPHVSAIATAIDERPEGSVMVVAPSVAEVETIAQGLIDHLAQRRANRAGTTPTVVVAHSSLPPKEVTSAWVSAATRTDVILVGTREVTFWPMPDLGSIVVVEDARRMMRSPATPTVGVREVTVSRARARKLSIRFIAPVPSLEVLRLAPRILETPGRHWPLVEIADRAEEPPGSSVLLERTRHAVRTAAELGDVFVLVPRRGYAAAFRCANCGAVRRCRACGSAVSTTDVCARCGAEARACPECAAATWRPLGAGIGVVVDDLRRVVGDRVGPAEAGTRVTVGTERDLIARTDMVLAVAVDADGMVLAPNYRAGEDALRTLVRLAQTVQRGHGRRALIQTSDPDQSVLRALVAGTAGDFQATELAARRQADFPPFGSLIALEIAGDQGEMDDAVIADLGAGLGSGVVVHGPAVSNGRMRWLIAGRDLDDARVALRGIVGRMRDRGVRVRVDVDPIDL
jgi:primosomal protein N' (replication factor Y)